jgi:hypothetical protein
MPNMSYCRFQNTLQDLRDYYENMEEKKAKARLIKLCPRIVAEYGDSDE